MTYLQLAKAKVLQDGELRSDRYHCFADVRQTADGPRWQVTDIEAKVFTRDSVLQPA